MGGLDKGVPRPVERCLPDQYLGALPGAAEAAAVERVRSLLAERGVGLGPVEAAGLPDFAEQ